MKKRILTTILAVLMALPAIVFPISPALAVTDFMAELTWGSYGEASGQFRYPMEIAEIAGDIWTTDGSNSRIQIFSKDGAFKKSIHSLGTPSRIAYNSTLDLVYVTDRIEKKIYVFKKNGDRVNTINTETVDPVGITVDSDSNYWVTFYDGQALKKFNKDGLELKSCSPGLWFAGDLDILSDGTLVVADTLNYRILTINPETCSIIKNIPAGSGPEEFDGAEGLAVDKNDLIYVGDDGNSKIQVFDKEGNNMKSYGSFGTALGQFSTPSGIEVIDGKMYVIDGLLHRVTKFVDINVPQGEVRSLSATAGATGVTLKWENSVSNSKVRILRSLNSNGCAINVTPDANHTQIYEGTGTTFADTTVAEGKTYCYSAYAYDKYSHWSTIAVTKTAISWQTPKLSMSRLYSTHTYGKYNKLSGYLKDVDGKALASKTVYIQKYDPTKKAWVWMKTLTTNTSGYVTYSWKPTGYYSYRLATPAVGTYKKAYSAPLSINVTPYKAWWNPLSSIGYGQYTKISGRYLSSFGKPATRVYVQKWNGSNWTLVKTLYPDSSGYFAYSFKANWCGAKYYRFQISGTSTVSPKLLKYSSCSK